MSLRAATLHQIWAIEATALHALDARAASLSALQDKGLQITAELSPAEKPDVVYNGGNPLVPEIVGGVATLELQGDLVARAPWWAKAYLGVIDQFDLADAIDALAIDPSVSSLVLEMDSCGGSVAGTSEAAAAMWRFQSAGKTITVRAAGTLASAAYWIASQADRIEATPTTRVGSLGTMCTLMDSTAADAAMGLKFEVIASGPAKGLGGDGAITPALRTSATKMITDLTALFQAQVATARKIPDTAALFTGEVWLAADALRLGLIDAVTSPADELDQAAGTTPAPLPIAPPLQDDPMDAKTLASLAELSAKHPTHAAALVAAANKPGATPDTLAAALHQADALAQTDSLKAQVTALTTDRDTTKAALTAEQTAHAATKAELTKAKALLGIAQSAGTDPGGDSTTAQVPNEAKWRAEFAASADLQDQFYAGADSYVAHKRMELAEAKAKAKAK